MYIIYIYTYSGGTGEAKDENDEREKVKNKLDTRSWESLIGLALAPSLH